MYGSRSQEAKAWHLKQMYEIVNFLRISDQAGLRFHTVEHDSDAWRASAADIKLFESSVEDLFDNVIFTNETSAYMESRLNELPLCQQNKLEFKSTTPKQRYDIQETEKTFEEWEIFVRSKEMLWIWLLRHNETQGPESPNWMNFKDKATIQVQRRQKTGVYY